MATLRTGLACLYGREDDLFEISDDVVDVRKEGPDLAESKAKVLEAVSEAARKLDGLKKDALVAQTQQHLEGRRWLPSVLRAKN